MRSIAGRDCTLAPGQYEHKSALLVRLSRGGICISRYPGRANSLEEDSSLFNPSPLNTQIEQRINGEQVQKKQNVQDNECLGDSVKEGVHRRY